MNSSSNKENRSDIGIANTIHSDSIGMDSDGINSDNAVTKEKGTGRSKKSSVRNKKSNTKKDESLFDALCSNSIVISSVIHDWIDSFTSNQILGLQELIQFLIHSSGCHGSVDTAAIEDADFITDCLDQLEKEMMGNVDDDGEQEMDNAVTKKVNSKSYPILLSKFRKQFIDFWSKWIQSLQSSLLYSDQDNCLETIIQWLATMSSSACRPFRHTATLVSLTIITNLCIIYHSCQSELEKLQGQKESKQVLLLIQGLIKKKKRLESFQTDLFNGIFVHRYRDIDPLIRIDCLHELSCWIVKCPDLYLDAQYVRYLGWMLSDKASNVRLQSIKSIQMLLKTPELCGGLLAFMERFKDRLFSMAFCEKETSVRLEAVKCIVMVNKVGLLDQQDVVRGSILMMDHLEKVRDQSVPLILDYLQTEFIDPLVQGYENGTLDLQIHKTSKKVQKGTKMTSDVRKNVELKALCQMMLSISKNVFETSLEMKKKKMESIVPLLEIPNELEIPTSMNQEEMDRELDGFVSWIEKKATITTLDSTTIGSNHIKTCISSLCEHVEILDDVHGFIELMENNILVDGILTTEEISCVLYMFSSLITNSLQHNGTSKQIVDEKMKTMVLLLHTFPKLLSIYSKEFTGVGFEILIELIVLLQSIDIEMIPKEQLETSFMILIDLLLNLLHDHSSLLLGKEIGLVFHNVINQATALESKDVGFVSLKESILVKVNGALEAFLTRVQEITESMVDVLHQEDEDQNTESQLLSFQTLCTMLMRIHSLCQNMNIFDLLCIRGWKMNDEVGTLFPLMNQCIETSLQILKRHTDNPTNESKVFYGICNQNLEFSLQIMFMEYVVGMSQLYSMTTIDENVIEKWNKRKESLINLCEAIVCDGTGEFFKIPFTNFQRMICFEILLDMVPLLEGKMKQKSEVFGRNFSITFQNEVANLVESFFEFIIIRAPRFESFQTLTLQAKMDMKFYMLTLITKIQKNITRTRIPFIVGKSLLMFYGFDEDVATIWPMYDQENQVYDKYTGILGTVWNGICDAFIKETFGEFPNFVEHVYRLDIEQERKLEQIKSSCTEMALLMVETVQKQFDLFITRKIPNLSSIEKFIKSFVPIFKSWTTKFSVNTFSKRNVNYQNNRSPGQFMKHVHDIIQDVFLFTFESRFISYINRLVQWKQLRDKLCVEMDITFQTTFDDTDRNQLIESFPDSYNIVSDIESINETWNCFGLLWKMQCNFISTLEPIDPQYSIPKVCDNVKSHFEASLLMEDEMDLKSFFNTMTIDKVAKVAGKRKQGVGKRNVKKMLASPTSSPIQQRRSSTRLSMKKKPKKQVFGSDSEIFKNEESEDEQEMDSPRSINELKRSRSPVIEFQNSPEMGSKRLRQ